MRIPENKIEEVRHASDVVDVISNYVKLKRRGKNYIGLCPFHTEKTPSFNVSPERQMYHCFGCGVGGNVITFVMEYEKVSFVEAIRTLADRAGISLPQEGVVDDKEKITESESLYAVCRAAARFFYDNMTTTVEGQLALEYFRHRGFSDETVRAFGLGYSMNAWDTLLKFAEREKLPLEMMEKAGLLIQREDKSGYYDRFRGRAMFPIFAVTGRVIGFGARKLREDDPLPGKYINSPETPIYVKSKSLYGISHAKDAIREKEYAILVEGYADLISVYQAGIKNIVASSGTALTDEQIELIGRYAKKVTLVYDADSAGSKATMRGVDLIIEQGLDVRIAELPEGDDPDSFVKTNGGEAFQKLLDEAASFLDFKARLFQSQGMLETPEGQAQAVRSIVETIAKMKDELKRGFYIKSLSERYGIYESTLYRELEKLLGKERGRERIERLRDERLRDERHRDERSQSLNPESSIQQASSRPSSVPAPERDLLTLMLEHGNEMVGYVFTHVKLEHFTHPLAQKVLALIIPHLERSEKWDTNSLIDETDNVELRRFITDITFSKYELSKGWKEQGAMPEEADPGDIADSCMMILKRQELERLIAENQQHMKEAAARGEEVRRFAEHHQLLMREKKDLEMYGLTGEREVPG
ncbi:MAG: DNA primase [Ignavibacteriae bacterium]|nr:DNA primase [Ignavibacteriota bacterium]